MNLREFTELQKGDKVENAMTNGEGTVSETQETRFGRIVSIKWGPSNIEFSYTNHSTAWTHWNVKEKADVVEREREHPAKDGARQRLNGTVQLRSP